MDLIGWILTILGILILLVIIIKIATRNRNEDEFGNRLSGIGKLWDECCRRTKGGSGI